VLLIYFLFITGVVHNFIHLDQEYIAELREDKVLEDWSLFYFEIWKLNDLKKVSHTCTTSKPFAY
jgi:hypothetical protein